MVSERNVSLLSTRSVVLNSHLKLALGIITAGTKFKVNWCSKDVLSFQLAPNTHSNTRPIKNPKSFILHTIEWHRTDLMTNIFTRFPTTKHASRSVGSRVFIWNDNFTRFLQALTQINSMVKKQKESIIKEFQ